MATPTKNQAPTPKISKSKSVDWLFIFKFNTATFGKGKKRNGEKEIFGNRKLKYYGGRYSQQYIYASSDNANLKKGTGDIGATFNDPLGATFAQIYFGDYNYVVWNDQFYDNPIATESAPWGHSKGVLAWNDAGEGMVIQVSTPSWPGSANHLFPRKNDGNTLGAVNDDDIEVSQHFFALKLSKRDVVEVLQGIQNASVLTNTSKPGIFKNGGPADIQALANKLGKESDSTKCTLNTLSSGVKIISKPSDLHVPPWQLVSAKLGSLPLRVASWWKYPAIYSTNASSHINCWVNGIGKTGDIEIATSGTWGSKKIGLTGGSGLNYNHAKIAVSQNPKKTFSVFGDMNQQGSINSKDRKCKSSQNGRGGTFYAMDNPTLWNSLTALLKGESAPTSKPPSANKNKRIKNSNLKKFEK